MAEIVLARVGKVYDNGIRAVDGLDLTVGDGELLALVGPSGCGKTTTLRLIAGLENPTWGEIRIGGKVVHDLPARERKVAMVFQRPALLPNKTVRRNLAFGQCLRHPWGWLMPPPGQEDFTRAVEQTARTLGLE